MKINFKNTTSSVTVVTVVAVLVFLLSGWNPVLGPAHGASESIILTRSRLMMGHVPVNVEIRTQPGERAQALAASEAAYQEAARLEALLSEYQPDSEITCLNGKAGQGPCHLSPETVELLRRAMDFSQRTGGAFDIRFNSLSEAGRRGKIEIAAQGASGSLEHPETRLGLGAIAKGYIVEAMSAVLTRQGFPDHLINAGGDLVARGGPWEVALQIPGAAPGKFTRKEKIKNRAVSTSGSYEQGAHILDPRSGKKVLRTGAVTVIAEDPIAADSLATAFFVMGKAAAEIFLKNFPGVEMIWLEPSEM